MKPSIDLGAVREVHAWEYLLRFVFGGVVTACTGLIAQAYGAEIGGLFLAFPAILPASLTLVKYHDGRTRAYEDARGARLGAAATTVFAAVVLATAAHHAPLFTLCAATIGWATVSAALWAVIHARGSK